MKPDTMSPEGPLTPDQVLGEIRKQSFRPFRVRTGSGAEYPVDHPEQISISPSGRTVSVCLDNEDRAIVDTSEITEFVASPRGEG